MKYKICNLLHFTVILIGSYFCFKTTVVLVATAACLCMFILHQPHSFFTKTKKTTRRKQTVNDIGCMFSDVYSFTINFLSF